jgi:hypothetical protein
MHVQSTQAKKLLLFRCWLQAAWPLHGYLNNTTVQIGPDVSPFAVVAQVQQ